MLSNILMSKYEIIDDPFIYYNKYDFIQNLLKMHPKNNVLFFKNDNVLYVDREIVNRLTDKQLNDKILEYENDYIRLYDYVEVEYAYELINKILEILYNLQMKKNKCY